MDPLSTAPLRTSGKSISYKSAVEEGMKGDRMRETNSESSPLIISCHSIKPIIHDFEKNR